MSGQPGSVERLVEARYGTTPAGVGRLAGNATIETDRLAELTRMVFANIDYDEPEDLDHWLESQQRVIIRLHPTRVSGVIR